MSMPMSISVHATSHYLSFSHCRRIPRKILTDVSRERYHRWIAIVIETVVDIVLFLHCRHCLRFLPYNRPLQIEKVQGLQRCDLQIPHYLVLGMTDGIFHDCVEEADAVGADFDVLGDAVADRSCRCSPLAQCHV